MRSLVPAWNVVTLEIACAVWAINRRGVPLDALGKGVRPLAHTMLTMLPIGSEGEAILDLGPLVDAVKHAVARTHA